MKTYLLAIFTIIICLLTYFNGQQHFGVPEKSYIPSKGIVWPSKECPNARSGCPNAREFIP